MVEQNWKIEAEGHSIRVYNNWFGPSRLYIDEKLQDSVFALTSLELIGRISDGRTEKIVKAHLKTKFLSVLCDIYLDNKLVYSSTKK